MSDRNTLVEENVRLVHSCCKRFVGRGIEYDDLFQVGCLGLLKAADGFDESRGLCFSTYAVPTIIGEIKRLFRDTGSIKVSRSLKELSMKVSRERELLEKDGQDITLKLLSERLCVPEEEIAEAIAASRSVMSLTCKGDDGICELDLPSASYENEICSKLLINEAILSLNEEEQEIIKLRFYAEKTQTESAKILGISQVQVSRKEKKALAKLRVFMK